MQPEWYSEWVKAHLITFGLVRPEMVAMFGSWWASFSARGFSADELMRATMTIRNSTNQPDSASNHFNAIKQAIGIDRESREPTQTDFDNGPECSDCRRTGIISVPHPNYCNAMEWRPVRHNFQGDPIYATAGVFCTRCPSGRKAVEQNRASASEGKLKAGMTIETYEQTINGNWREQIAWHEGKRKQVAEADAMRPNEKEIVQRLAAGFGSKA